MPTFDSLRQDLNECFKQTDPTASYACSAPVSQFPHPGLTVNDVGPIGLPLTDTTKLRSVCHRAAFGKGRKTVVDENVRKTLEINADQVSFANPAWQPWIEEAIVPSVLKQLGISESHSRGTRLEFYKLLLYDEGAMFKSHQDSEKAAGMFGTLAICLPTAHEGGELLLRHGSATKTWTSSQDSLYSLSYGAWYSDVFHEIQPVTSGHRLVLIYNLIQSSGPTEFLQAATCGQSDLRLERALHTWNDEKTIENSDLEFHHLCWALEHQYTMRSLKLSTLKGHDRSVVKLAARKAQETGHSVYLATVEREVHGECEPYDTDDEEMGFEGSRRILDVYKDKWLLQEVVDLSGAAVTSKVDVSRRHMIQQDIFDKTMEPCDEDYSGYTGNEGVTNTLWYRVSVMVIVPAYDDSLFCLGPALSGNISPDKIVKMIMARCKSSPSDTRPKSTLKHALTMLVDRAAKKEQTQWQSLSSYYTTHDRHMDSDTDSDFHLESEPNESDRDCGRPDAISRFPLHRRPKVDKSPSEKLVSMSRGALFLDRPDLFSTIMSKVEQSPRNSLTRVLFEDLAHKSLSEYTESLTILFASYKTLGSLASALRAAHDSIDFGEDMLDVNLETFCEWSRPILQRMLRATPCPLQQDSISLAAIVLDCGVTSFDKDVLPWLKTQNNPQALWSFLCGCVKNSRLISDFSSEDTWYADLIEIYLPHFQMAFAPDFNGQIGSAVERNRTGLSTDYRSHNERTTHTPSTKVASDIAGTVINLWDCDALRVADKFLTAFAKEAVTLGRTKPASFANISIPVLRDLANQLADRHAQRTPALRRQFAWILSAFVAYTVGPAPPKNTSWVKMESRCACEDCAKVNEFMRDPFQTQHSLRANEKKRRHVEESFGIMDCSYETKRTGSPHALIITKHHNGYPLRRAEWKDNIRKARQTVDSFNKDVLADMTGSDWEWLHNMAKMESQVTDSWVAAVKLACERPDRGFATDETEQAHPPLQAVSGNSLKRKADAIVVCDLTED